MTPKRLQSLWRERWGKPDAAAEIQPYLNGAIGNWGERVSDSTAWSIPGLGILAAVLFAGLTLLLVGVRFSVADQLWLSCFVIVVSLVIRRYQVQMLSLVLLCFAAISTSRYLYWRFNDTLGPDFTIGFFLALVLWALEVYGAVLFALGIAQSLWPAKQALMPLPEDMSSWPTVDILVLATGRSTEDVERSVSALQNTAWPRSKFSITVIDATERDALRRTLSAENAHYLSFPNDTQGVAVQLNQALASSNAELAVIVIAGQTPSADFLKESLGWFLDDASLGVLCTPHHFLAPEPTHSLVKQLSLPASQAEFLITRISLCLKAGGIPFEPLSAQHHVARNLQCSGFGHGYLIEQNGVKWRLHEPFAGNSINLRLWVERARDALLFFKPLLWVVLWVLPLPYLLTEVELVNTTPLLWLTYAVPHLTQAYLLQSRTQSTQRPNLWLEIRDASQSMYLLVLTFFTVVWTQVHQWKKQTGEQPLSEEELAIRMSALDVVLALLHGAAIVAGISTLLYGERVDTHKVGFFLVWSGFIVFLLAAKLAVAREAQEVTKQKHRLKVMPAMIRLPNNRTLVCQTSNFPATPLEVTFSSNQRLVKGQDLKLSLFHHLEECALSVQVLAITTSTLTVTMDAADQAQYARFCQAVFARGADWPNWLPGQQVDRIIPLWLIKGIEWALDQFARLIHRFDRKPVAIATDNASMKWKKKA